MQLVESEFYIVKAIELNNYGVVVELEDDTTQLIHISQISNEYVSTVESYVSVGVQYQAKAVNVNGRVQLSLKHLYLKSCDKKPKYQEHADRSKKRSSHTQKQHHDSTTSLDDMIAQAEAQYKDKMQNKKKKHKRRK